MLEPPTFSDNVIPDVMLLPLLAFDKEKNRLGYGKGYYDKFLSKHLIKKKILTVGIGFSFQEYSKIPSFNSSSKTLTFRYPLNINLLTFLESF